MSEAVDRYDDRVLRRRLAQWRSAGVLAPENVARAREVLGIGGPDWRRFLDLLAIWCGAALVGAGIVFFVAANWDQLGKLARLGGLQVLLIAATVAAVRLSQRRTAFESMVLLSVLILGALLALLGQTYQTGADTWQLFALWAALAVPWAVGGRSAVVWLLWIVIVDTALLLWLDLHPWRALGRWNQPALVGIVNVAFLFAWDCAALHWTEFQSRIGPRALAAFAVAALTIGAVGAVLDSRRDFGFDLLPWLAITAFMIRRYWIDRRDVVVLAMLALGVIVVVTTLLGHGLLRDGIDSAFALLVLAAAVIGQSAVAAVWLRRLAREDEA